MEQVQISNISDHIDQVETPNISDHIDQVEYLNDNGPLTIINGCPITRYAD